MSDAKSNPDERMPAMRNDPVAGSSWPVRLPTRDPPSPSRRTLTTSTLAGGPAVGCMSRFQVKVSQPMKRGSLHSTVPA